MRRIVGGTGQVEQTLGSIPQEKLQPGQGKLKGQVVNASATERFSARLQVSRVTLKQSVWLVANHCRGL